MDANFDFHWTDRAMKADITHIRGFLLLLHKYRFAACPFGDPDHAQMLFVAKSPEDAVRWARKFLSEEEWQSCAGAPTTPPAPAAPARQSLQGVEELGDGGIDDEDLLNANAALSSQLRVQPQPSVPARYVPDSDALSALSDAGESPPTTPNPKRRKLSPAPDGGGSPPEATTSEPVFAPSQLIHTVTSKNRDKLRRRQKKKEKARLAALSSTRVADEDADEETDDEVDPSDRDDEMGEEGDDAGQEATHAPVESSNGNRDRTEELQRDVEQAPLPDADTPAEEKIKNAVTSEDLPALRWVMRARVPKSTATARSGRISYRVADQMIQKAKAIGSLPALESWKTISTHWRANGTLTSINLYSQDPTSSQEVALPSHLDQQAAEVRAFYRAFQAASQSEVNILLQAIFHRRILADLFQRYRSAEGAIAASAQRGTSRGRGVADVTQAKLQLFRALYPDYESIHRPGDDPRSRKDWLHFGKQLEKGRRWNEVESCLGAGILAFIPETIVSHTWVEKGLPWDVFCVWLQLVKEHNQAAVLQGEQMLARLGDALAGRQIPPNRLRLEKVRLAELKDVDDKSILLEEIDAEVDFSTDEE
jgi:hypothetical protein